MRFIRQAQKARHDYADVLDAAFRTDAGHLEKSLSIILKLGRYGIASRAVFQLAREFPALFSSIAVKSIPSPTQAPTNETDLNFGLALRRIVGKKEKEYLGRLRTLQRETRRATFHDNARPVSLSMRRYSSWGFTTRTLSFYRLFASLEWVRDLATSATNFWPFTRSLFARPRATRSSTPPGHFLLLDTIKYMTVINP